MKKLILWEIAISVLGVAMFFCVRKYLNESIPISIFAIIAAIVAIMAIPSQSVTIDSNLQLMSGFIGIVTAIIIMLTYVAFLNLNNYDLISSVFAFSIVAGVLIIGCYEISIRHIHKHVKGELRTNRILISLFAESAVIITGVSIIL